MHRKSLICETTDLFFRRPGTLSNSNQHPDHSLIFQCQPSDQKTSRAISTNVAQTYDGNHQRYKQIYSSGPGDITYTIGKEFEKVYNTSGIYDYRHYVFAGDKRVALVSRLATGVNTTYYFLGDHISSTTSILNANGTDYVDANFSAYGAGRDPANWSGAIGNRGPFYATTLNLFTGQQTHLLMNLVNLNGRMLDAVTGRMMSADPTIPDPGNTQSYNRYSYVKNNPLTQVDPTGFADDPPKLELPYDVPTDGNSGTVLSEVVVEASREAVIQVTNPQSNPVGNLSTASSSSGCFSLCQLSDPQQAITKKPPKALAQSPLQKLINGICAAPAGTFGVQLQLDIGFLKIFSGEGQVSLSVTTHGQIIWTETSGGVLGLNRGLVLSGGLQGGLTKTDAPSGFSTTGTLGGEVIVTAGAGFNVGASEATDASGLTVNALGRAGFATGGGLVAGLSYQRGLVIASPSLCSLRKPGVP